VTTPGRRRINVGLDPLPIDLRSRAWQNTTQTSKTPRRRQLNFELGEQGERRGTWAVDRGRHGEDRHRPRTGGMHRRGRKESAEVQEVARAHLRAGLYEKGADERGRAVTRRQRVLFFFLIFLYQLKQRWHRADTCIPHRPGLRYVVPRDSGQLLSGSSKRHRWARI
jgi:hypothetical protein